MRYRGEIDGLRALAVVPVILFHAGVQTFSGGFVGVDVFFVISGYLITTILLNDLGAASFSILHFYERRARRILPALFLVMFISLPFAWFWLLPNDMDSYSRSLGMVSLFSSNFLFLKESGYFDTATELKPFIHTWSLAVEEQFYLLFPLFLIATLRFGKRWVLSILGITAVISLAAAHWGALAYPEFTFFMLPTRAWELAIGAFIAFYYAEHNIRRHKHWAAQWGSLLGLILILFAVFAYSKNTPFPSLYALAPTLGAALIIVFATHETWVGKLLCTKPFVGIGLISYSAYLWHQPMLAFARQSSLDAPSKTLMIAIAISSFMLAYMSWRFVERPFRNKHRFTRRQVFVASIVASLFFIGLGVLGHKSKGFLTRFPKEQDLYSYEKYDHESIYRDGVCFLRPEQTFADFKKECDLQNINSLFIWGDSHAAALSYGLRSMTPSVVQYTASGCPPLKGEVIDWRPNCYEINNFVLSKIATLAPEIVFLHANWLMFKDNNLAAGITKTIDYIRKYTPSSKILLIGPVPQWVPSLPKVLSIQHVYLDSVHYAKNGSINELRLLSNDLQKIAIKNNVSYFSPIDNLCEGDYCLATVFYGEKIMPTAWDYGHLTAGGSVELARKLVGSGALLHAADQGN